MSTKFEVEDTQDIIRQDFHAKTHGNFLLVNGALPPIGFECGVYGKDLHAPIVIKRHATSPNQAEREAIAEMLPLWDQIQAEQALADKLEAAALAELADDED